MPVELADRLEMRRRLQAHDGVRQRFDLLQGVGRRHRHGAHQFGGMAGAQGVQRRDHRGAGCQTVVDDDHDAPGRVDRRADRRVLGASAPDGLHLRAFFGLEVVRIGAVGLCERRDISPAAFIDRTHRQFALVGRAQLAHQHHVELAVQPLGDGAGHRHRTAGYRQHERVPTPVGLEPLGQPGSSVVAVDEHGAGKCAAD